jgi:outer membrane protein W
MKILKTLVFAVLSTAATAMAQEQMTTLTWNMGLPSGRMADIMGKTSYSGFGLSFERFLNEEFTVGGGFSWNYWSELTDQIIQIPHGAVSGTQIRYINSFPMFLNAHYYLNKRGEDFRPFVGLNVGAYYIEQRLEIGVYAFNDHTWHFGLAPEAGFLYRTSDETFLTAAARYNSALSSGTTVLGTGTNELAYWGINVGMVWVSGWF